MVWDYMPDTAWIIRQDEIPALTPALKPLELDLERSVVLQLLLGPAPEKRLLERLACRHGKSLLRIETLAAAVVEVYLVEHTRILKHARLRTIWSTILR